MAKKRTIGKSSPKGTKAKTAKKPARASRSTAAPPKAQSKSLNRGLGAARVAKKDEFYTQYDDIQKEVEAYLEYDPEQRQQEQDL